VNRSFGLHPTGTTPGTRKDRSGIVGRQQLRIPAPGSRNDAPARRSANRTMSPRGGLGDQSVRECAAFDRCT
jgi:hypothetical protein